MRNVVCAAVLLALGLSPKLARGQSYVPTAYRTFPEAAAAWHRYAETCRRYDARVAPLRASFESAQGDAIRLQPALRAELARRITEKQVGMDEFRRGLRCSKCRKTQTELGGPVSFRAHLGDVKGAPLPPTPEEIVQKEHEYDQGIREIAGKISDLQERVTRAQEPLNSALAERQTACEAAALARSAALRLKSLEDLSKRDAGSSDADTYECESFPEEARRNLYELRRKIGTLEKDAAIEGNLGRASRLECDRANSMAKAETDPNRRRVFELAAQSNRLAAILHEQQSTQLSAQLSSTRKTALDLEECLKRVAQ